MLVLASDIVPIAGVALANAKCLSPLPALLRARAASSLGALNPLPLVAVTGVHANVFISRSCGCAHCE